MQICLEGWELKVEAVPSGVLDPATNSAFPASGTMAKHGGSFLPTLFVSKFCLQEFRPQRVRVWREEQRAREKQHPGSRQLGEV